MVFHNKLFWNL